MMETINQHVTLDDLAVLSGEELVLRYGPAVRQQLTDLMVSAVRSGDSHKMIAIDKRAQEVNSILQVKLSAWMRSVTTSPDH